MASRGLLTMDPNIQPQSPCGLFQNAQEIANLGPASLKVDPLAKVMTPIEARIAADEGRIVMFSDIDCQSQIEQIATVVYEIERKAWIWHKNVCGENAGNNLLHKLLQGIHGVKIKNRSSTDAVPQTSDDHVTGPVVNRGRSIRSLKMNTQICQFVGKKEKPCSLPSLEQQPLAHLSQFDCLFYVLVSKIRELHTELSDRLSHGLITPETRLYRARDPDHANSTVRQILEQFRFLWSALVAPELIATLDVALRLRALGYWSMILDGRGFVTDARTPDCKLHRENLSKHPLKNMAFLKALGLVNVFEESMSCPMICMLVDSLQHKVSQEKEEKQVAINGNRQTLRKEMFNNVSDMLGQRQKSPERHSKQSKADRGVSNQCTMSTHDIKSSGDESQIARLVPHQPEAVSKHDSCRTSGRIHKPRQQYALDLYSDNRVVPAHRPKEANMTAANTSSGQSDKKLICHPRIQSPCIGVDPQMNLSEKSGRRSDGSVKSHEMNPFLCEEDTIVATNLSRVQLAALKAAVGYEPNTTFIEASRTDSHNQLDAMVTDNDLNGISDAPHRSMSNQDSGLSSQVSPQESHKGQNLQPQKSYSDIPAPSLEGTWTVSRNDLWALLPATPKYTSPSSQGSKSSKSSSSRKSMNFLGVSKRARSEGGRGVIMDKVLKMTKRV